MTIPQLETLRSEMEKVARETTYCDQAAAVLECLIQFAQILEGAQIAEDINNNLTQDADKSDPEGE